MDVQADPNKCVMCKKSVLRRRSYLLWDRRSDQHQPILREISSMIQPRIICSSDSCCFACWQKCSRSVSRRLQPDMPSVSGASEFAGSTNNPNINVLLDIEEPETEEEENLDRDREKDTQNDETPQSGNTSNRIRLPNNKRAAHNPNRCIFVGCENTSRVRPPYEVRQMVLLNYNFYIPPEARICNEHMESHLWDSLYYAENSINSFTATDIEDAFSMLKLQCKKPRFNVENPIVLNEIELKYWTGLNAAQFNSILDEAPTLKATKRERTALAVLLTKLRTAESNERLSTLFDIPRSTLESLMCTARKNLTKEFVPLHLGLQHLTRSAVIARNTFMANGLFGNSEAPLEDQKCISVWDGTYAYVQKSSNYNFQRTSYSMHRNLLKPFMAVCTDGYIIDVFGPYNATTLDATIMRDLFQDAAGPLRSFFADGDIFVLDRGFRDCVRELRAYNYDVFTPECRSGTNEQLTTEQANQSRRVTITRFIVEVVNGRFKNYFKIFRHEFCNRSVPHLMEDFKIAAAIINMIWQPLQDRDDAQIIMSVLKQRMSVPNKLSRFVIENNINRKRVAFTPINASENATLENFPRLTENDLIHLTLGSYQLKQAKSYYAEHIKDDGSYCIEVYRDTDIQQLQNYNIILQSPCLLRGRIRSRHISSKVYYTYILYCEQQHGRESISEYYCSCIVGNRTVGCCAHIACIVWYLGWARHETNISIPAIFLDNVTIEWDE